MFPFTSLFTARNRRRHEPERSVLDEEYEWVFGRKAREAHRSDRSHPADSQNRFEEGSR